ncbi:VOC family protein [Diaphorobacter aerolatus]|uniref:VOC family protein n=1 Tax=Diaphorobacter aerolatus TaxID=1288495 RepID=A0A7H0GHA6_9BURK|nr:VOC family protein [Diaphorobacter aerolatus]QNP47672.1 VOC family protein [Diaphorobacter aerolatus]
MNAANASRLDHLVVLADTLNEGVRWCEKTLGVIPDAGGEHPLMGTHNRLINVACAAFPRAYLEIIALDAKAVPTRSAGQQRWFDMDDPVLLAQVAQHGPQLIHWVAAVPDLARAHAAWRTQLGVDRGTLIHASRPTATGLLEWQITVRDDGQRLMSGCLPTLIQWGDVHPCDSLPPSGVRLDALQLEHPDAQLLRDALDAAGLPRAHITIEHASTPAIRATLSTPRGLVTLTTSHAA